MEEVRHTRLRSPALRLSQGSHTLKQTKAYKNRDSRASKSFFFFLTALAAQPVSQSVGRFYTRNLQKHKGQQIFDGFYSIIFQLNKSNFGISSGIIVIELELKRYQSLFKSYYWIFEDNCVYAIKEISSHDSSLINQKIFICNVLLPACRFFLCIVKTELQAC